MNLWKRLLGGQRHGPQPEEPGGLFAQVPVTHESFKAVMEKRVPRKYSDVGQHVHVTLFVEYPETPPDGVTYLQTWNEPVGLVRLSDDWPENIYTSIRNAAEDGRASLRIKCYKYATYPVLQFVLTVELPEFPDKPWKQETLGDISDGNFQGFVLDAVTLSRWKLVVGRHRTDPAREASALKETPVRVSEQWSSNVILEVREAVHHFLSIPIADRDFHRAGRQFLNDNVPM